MHTLAIICFISFCLGSALVIIGGIIDIVFELTTNVGKWMAKIGLVLLGIAVIILTSTIIYAGLDNLS